ncbi:cytochrome o ubiquinol oxidase subunit IV [Paenibacillus selenitireducens]|jgi:cytochrome o ubiquinol oxidase operon protein cyoD|uniref:Cytochrome o ubiquinol oxidase subunit IV n=1 Tax=Paenibacillus selenitireducens TaxID=1324314 RepID=A0A1T2XHF5_9BACL|nr:cytochrome o ubiquinol oxidase subunit IV [Paenibacillus selenitireducens]OPA79238.1 cytochrome o ubiquinol oxidase subunit IV [Paenibacillus selenitireducens]
MAQHETAHEESHGSLKTYSIGFLCSIVLTIIPIAIVLGGWFDGMVSKVVLMGAAALQFIVQLIFFMHLREEQKPRYNLMALILGIVILLIIVVGSMWIMLYNMVAV